MCETRRNAAFPLGSLPQFPLSIRVSVRLWRQLKSGVL